MPNYDPNLSDKIFFIDIGKGENTDLFRWKGKMSKLFLLDILSAREQAKEGYFLHFEKTKHRMAYIKHKDIVFIICALESVQYQLIEAILEEVIEQFFSSYEEIINDPILLSGMISSFAGFESLISEIFDIGQKNRVKWLKTDCKICGDKKNICVKKSLIQNAKSHPVSLVFKHAGHGLLLYIDRQFALRGSETVELSG